MQFRFDERGGWGVVGGGGWGEGGSRCSSSSIMENTIGHA